MSTTQTWQTWGGQNPWATKSLDLTYHTLLFRLIHGEEHGHITSEERDEQLRLYAWLHHEDHKGAKT